MEHIVFLDTATVASTDLTALQIAKTTLSCYATTEPAELAARLRDATIVISNKVMLSANDIAQAPQLKLICIAATGTNNVDIAAATARGILVCNVREYALGAVPQHAMALLLTLNNQTAIQQQAVANGKWSQSPVFCLHQQPIQSLQDKVFTVVGYGSLGQATAQLAQAFGMRICIAERPNASEIRPGRVAFREALAQADVVSLHCPALPQQPPIIGADQLRWLKPSALLLNTARGQLIDEIALLQALQQGQLAGAALDVLTQEPPPPDHPLLAITMPNLLLSPHIAWATTESIQCLVAQLAENIVAFMSGSPLRTCNIIQSE